MPTFIFVKSNPYRLFSKYLSEYCIIAHPTPPAKISHDFHLHSPLSVSSNHIDNKRGLVSTVDSREYFVDKKKRIQWYMVLISYLIKSVHCTSRSLLQERYLAVIRYNDAIVLSHGCFVTSYSHFITVSSSHPSY